VLVADRTIKTAMVKLKRSLPFFGNFAVPEQKINEKSIRYALFRMTMKSSWCSLFLVYSTRTKTDAMENYFVCHIENHTLENI
jgi:hypothetical protein